MSTLARVWILNDALCVRTGVIIDCGSWCALKKVGTVLNKVNLEIGRRTWRERGRVV